MNETNFELCTMFCVWVFIINAAIAIVKIFGNKKKWKKTNETKWNEKGLRIEKGNENEMMLYTYNYYWLIYK